MTDKHTGGSLAQSPATAPANIPAKFNMVPQTLADARELATMVANSDLVPKDYRGKTGNVLVAWQMGAELGLQMMQALQNIAVINGRPSVYGDAMLALVKARPECDDVEETLTGEGDKMVATCIAKRVRKKPVVSTFSVDDAKKAKLWGKEGPWSNYPKRMLQMRARAFALRDAFPDILRGVSMAEEVIDIPPEDVVRVEPLREPTAISTPPRQPGAVTSPPATAPTANAPPAEQLQKPVDAEFVDAMDRNDNEPPPISDDDIVASQGGEPAGALEPDRRKPEAKTNGIPLTPGGINIIRNQLRAKKIDETRLCLAMKVGHIEELTTGQFQAAVDWIKNTNAV